MRGWRRFLRDDGGGMTVEFVTTLPMILAALVIVFEFGRGLWFHQIVSKSVRDATRFASRYSPLAAGCDTLEDDGTFVDAVRTVALGSTSLHGFWTDPSTVTVATALADSEADADGQQFRTRTTCVVTVRAQVPVNLATLAFLGLETGVTIDVADRARFIGD
jgi:Flp pilus assembly protein TadG